MKRLLLALSIGLVMGLLCLYCRTSPRWWAGPGDLRQALVPARDFLAGRQPLNNLVNATYIPSPLTIIPLGLPFVSWPGPLAAAFFIFVSYAWLVWSMLKHEQHWRLWLLLSPSVLITIVHAQYPPLLMALTMSGLAPLGLLIKPHIAIPLSLRYHAKWFIWAVAASILGLSLVLFPLWPITWLSQLHDYEIIIPVLAPLGFGLLLIALRWRDPQARMLLLYVLVPQRGIYDQMPALLVPPSQRALLLILISQWFLCMAPITEMMRVVLTYYLILISLSDKLANRHP